MNNKKKDKTQVSLVLGSGGARGLAHIGVIHCLEDNGYNIRYISGTSIGALIGGIYAAGKLDEYTKWVKELDKTHVLRLLDWSFSHGAIFKGDKIVKVLQNLIGEHDIEELPVGFTAVATDLDNEREVWLNRGPLFDAIRASIAVPMVFEPVRYAGKLLVDGGLVNPIPMAPVMNHHSDLIMAVDLNAAAEGGAGPAQASVPPATGSGEYRARIMHFIESFLPHSSAPDPSDFPGLFDLMMRSMDVMQTTIARFKLAGYAPDLTVDIPRDKCGFFEFYRAAELIDFGYERAQHTLKRLLQGGD